MKVQVILGSTRQGRVTERVSQWVVKNLEADNKVEVELVDLADYPLEFFAEPVSPQYNPNRQPSEAVQKWLDKLAEADAYVVVTPEYNRSISGVLKNALDHVAFEMKHKPVAIVSHGSVGGAFASNALRSILPQVYGVVVPSTVYLHGASELFNEAGELSPEAAANPYGPQSALRKMLDELYWLGQSLATKPE